jgi:hypothetical protein
MELPDKLDFENPITDRLSSNNIDSLVKNIKIALLNNHTINSDMSNIIQKMVDNVPDTIKRYTILEEKYDDIGNSITKLVNLGYSVGVDTRGEGITNFNYNEFLKGLKSIDYVMNHTNKLPKYDGSEILDKSILATTSNIEDTFSIIGEYEDDQWFGIIIGKCFQYGYVVGCSIISDYKKDLRDLIKSGSLDPDESREARNRYTYI